MHGSGDEGVPGTWAFTRGAAKGKPSADPRERVGHGRARARRAEHGIARHGGGRGRKEAIEARLCLLFTIASR